MTTTGLPEYIHDGTDPDTGLRFYVRQWPQDEHRYVNVQSVGDAPDVNWHGHMPGVTPKLIREKCAELAAEARNKTESARVRRDKRRAVV